MSVADQEYVLYHLLYTWKVYGYIFYLDLVVWTSLILDLRKDWNTILT